MKPYSLVALALLAACSNSQKAAPPGASEATMATGEEGKVATATASATPVDVVPPSSPAATTTPIVGGALEAKRSGGAGLSAMDGFKGDDGHLAAPAYNAPSTSIKAGEWDDNANYREFQRYLGTVTDPIHKVDLRARRGIAVHVDGDLPHAGAQTVQRVQTIVGGDG